MSKFAKGINSKNAKAITKNKYNDFSKFSVSSLLIILYKLTKFEAPGCNGF